MKQFFSGLSYNLLKIQIFLIYLLLTAGCSVFEKQTLPEEGLLKVFQEELRLIEQHQGGYIPYMEYQIAHFGKKNERTLKVIEDINRRFTGMSLEERRAYQEKWQESFQPVIDQIYHTTRTMIMQQKKSATQRELALIQELTIRKNLLEKNSRQAQLQPLLFNVPEGGADLEHFKE